MLAKNITDFLFLNFKEYQSKLKNLGLSNLNEEIIKRVMEQTGLSHREIIAFIQEKKRSFQGITEFGALIILCKDLCVDYVASIV